MLLELALVVYGRVIYEVTTVTLGSLLLDQPPKSKPFTPCLVVGRPCGARPTFYDHTAYNTTQPTPIPRP